MSRRPPFTLLVAGNRGGKTSFLRLLLDSLAPTHSLPCAGRTALFTTTHVLVPLDPAPVPLTLIDSPSLDFADELAAERILADTLRLIDHRFLDDLDRRHVHLCIYFLNPDTIHPPPHRPALPPPDINAIRRLSVRVNVLPVIARADLLSNHRLAALKLAVRRDLADAGIGFGIFDTDDHPDPPPPIADPSTTDQSPIMRLPYALVSPDSTDSDASPRPSFLRFYRWGNLDVLDPAHCDFVPLRNAIFHHMETLQKYTREYLFEKFRSDYIQQQQPPSRLRRSPHLPLPQRPILAIDTQPSHPSSSSIPSSTNQKKLPLDSPSSSARPARSSHLPATTTTTKQRSKKITVACNFCRSRKLKCDGGRPACAQCLKRAHHCDYAPLNKRRNTIRSYLPGSPSRPPGLATAGPDEDDDSTRAESGNEDGRSEVSMSPQVHSIPLSSSTAAAAPPPPASSAPISRRTSNIDPYLSLPPIRREREDRGVPSSSRGVPPSSRGAPPSSLHDRLVCDPKPPISSSLGPGSARSYFPDTDLPHIATLSLPDRSSPSTPAPMSAPSLPPIRPASDQQASLRKRAATVPGKTANARGSGSGPKVVACNSCRARKTKCDGAHPACASCARRQVTCLYVQDANGTINHTFLSPIVGSANSSPPIFRKRRQSTNPSPHHHASSSSAAAAAHPGYIKDEDGSLSPRPTANTPSTVGPELVDPHRVASRHHPSFRATSDTCRGDDGIVLDERKDRLISVDARDVVPGSGSREGVVKKVLHVDRDLEMRSPHDDPDTTNHMVSSEPLAHHPHRYSSHSYHSSSSSSLLRHDEMRAVKKMRIEVDSSSSASSSPSMMMMKKQGGHESPLSGGRLTVNSQP